MIPLIINLYDDPEEKTLSEFATMMQFEEKDAPNFFFLYGIDNELISYPDPITNIEDFSPNLLYSWALRTLHLTEWQKSEDLVKEWEDWVMEGNKMDDEQAELLKSLTEMSALRQALSS